MTSDRKPSPVLPVAATLAVLLALYVGAYYAMVQPTLVLGLETPGMYPFYGEGHPGMDEERWKWSERFATCFAPVHWLDRRVRPHHWE